MPSPPAYVKNYDPGVTNIRNTSSPHWRRWLGPANRCVVPFTWFAEPNPAGKVVAAGRQTCGSHEMRNAKLFDEGANGVASVPVDQIDHLRPLSKR
jgi:hypothetical protein